MMTLHAVLLYFSIFYLTKNKMNKSKNQIITFLQQKAQTDQKSKQYMDKTFFVTSCMM